MIVLVSGALLYFVGLGKFGIIDPGEAYYAESAREMVESGDYLTPHLNYQIYFSKPILTFWIMSFAYRIFGISEFSTRILFACLILSLLLATFWLGRSLYSRRCGTFAALLAATMPLMLACAKISPIDIAFAVFLNLFVFALVFVSILEESKWWPFVYVFLALAVLTKGPAAFVLAGLGSVIYLFVERAPWSLNKQRLRRLQVPVGLMILAVLILPWYCAVGVVTHGLFLKVFFLYENLARFAGMTNMAHTTWYHYCFVLAYALFPWILFLPQSLWFAIKPAFTKKISATSQAILFLACWALSVVVFFSISHTQLDTYILPAVAPFAVVIACYLENLLIKLSADDANKVSSKLGVGLVSGVFCLIGFFVVVLVCLFPLIKIPHAVVNIIGSSNAESLRFALIPPVTVLGVGYLLQFYFYRTKKYLAMFATLFFTSTIVCFGLSQLAFRIIDDSGQKDLRILLTELRRSADRLSVFQAFKPSMMFYASKPITSFFHPTQLLPLAGRSGNYGGVVSRKEENRPASGDLLIILNEKSLPLLQASGGIKLVLLKRQGAWLLYRAVNAKIEDMQTLETVFSNWSMVMRLVKSQNDVGPLTVPYAAGDPLWWRSQAKDLPETIN